MIKLKDLLTEGNQLVYKVDGNKVEKFLKKYPQVKKSMEPYIGSGKDMMKSYVKWLRWKDKNEDKLGGKAKEVNSPSFGKKTFYKHDFNGVSGWAEVFQYLSEND